MKWNDEVSPRFKRIFVTVLLFVVAIVLIVLRSGTPANADTIDPGVSTAPPVGFVDEGAELSEVQTDRLLNTTGNNKRGPCWGFDHNWPVTMSIAPHKQMYAPGIRVSWCANSKRTKVTKLILWQCYDAGGYYDYQGCKKSKGSLGYSSLGLSADYKYTWATGFPGVQDTRTPSIVFSVYTDGHIAGTIYFDN